MTPSVPPALELRGIEKRFGGVHANRAVSLTVARGSIHGLVGENGAGKSTLMNIVYGFHRPDAGEVYVNGRPVELHHPQDAIRAGIGMVHQHFMLVDTFTVLENIMLGAEGGRILASGLATARRELEALAADHHLNVPLDTLVSDLSVGLQQRVEILKAVYRRADLLILDEPTAVLTPQEADHLFRILEALRRKGKTILLVTHKLREIMAITDRVTVMRQGAIVHDTATRETSPEKLAEKMVGRSIGLQVEKKPAHFGPPLLTVKELVINDPRGVRRINGVSFTVCAGEIVGLAGVAGNGQSELLEALAGIQKPISGEIWLKDVELTRKAYDPRARRRLGLAHVPEDRLRMGVVASFDAQGNNILGYQNSPVYQHRGFSRPANIRAVCEQRMAAFDVRPAEPTQRISAFSGGNQQKLVLAREMEADPQVLLVGQPTRGVDIGAIEFIHRRLVALRDAGKALLLVSVELDEILALADRILVINSGAIVGEMTRAEASEERLGLLMAGVWEDGR